MRLLSSSFLIAFILSPNLGAQSIDDFDEISAKLDLEFDTQTQRIDDIYRAVDEAIDNAFRGLTKRIEVKWPDGALPERHRWVTYNSSLTSRAIADFESGQLVIETLVAPGENIQEKVAELMALSTSIATATPKQLDEQDILLQAVKKEVAAVTPELPEPAELTDTSLQNVLPDTIGPRLNSIAEALNTDLSELTIHDLSAVEKTANLSIQASTPAEYAKGEDTTKATVVPASHSLQPANDETPVPTRELNEAPEKEVVVTDSGTATVENNETVNASDSPKADNAFPAPPELPVLEVVSQGGQTKLKLSIDFVNDYQEKLVSHYFDDIKGYAENYDVPVSVIMAIIETESSYNPRAVSPVPAFGLMQLVPKTAGLDAHLFVHGEKKVVSADYLFNEDNNLKLGSAYFHLLTHRYLRKITDPQARFYCAVASYNTGVGNVAKTFTGRKSINAAVETINTMTPDAVYRYLIDHLPADETKNYLRKVVTRMEKYKQFDT